ncbi:CDP-alcohol phosphatidyltransferase family protein [Microbacterium fluvii]|uniref:CDP-alcohol phosphatidyltransferase family protein n=1 Tax=Microbacterium fluvii TaxID=415215 RepID=A0ABW2HIG5_9MICO|nr:CDP-alcohol phosphatidyltransferase family protein [Microbacterium fluvii]MCU4673936.1 CDP-alcohol phosphatidyltransferase family protein [Microbacterium fluvii]
MTDTQTTTFRTRFGELRAAQKRRTGVPLYTLAINRPVGRVLAAAAPPWATPNVLTAVGAVFTFAAILALMLWADGAAWNAVIGLALVIGFFFDSADGQLARLRGGGSALGEWLDHVIDGIRMVLLHLATLAYLVRVDVIPDAAAYALCLVFTVAASSTFFAGELFTKLTSVTATTTVTARSRARSALMLPVDYGVLCWVYLLLPLPVAFTTVYALIALAKVLTSTALLTKWYRTLRREDAARAATRV